MGQGTFQSDAVLVAHPVIGQHHREAPVLPQKDSIGAGHLRADVDDRLACILFFGIVFALHLHAAESLLRFWMGFRQLHIFFIACNSLCQSGNLCWIFAVYQFLQSIHLIQVAGLEHIQPCHLHIQIAFFDDKWVAGGQRLDLRIAQGGFVHIIRHADRGFAGHDLSNKFLLVLDELIQISIKCSLGYIAEDLHLLIFVTLTDNSSKPLLKVAGPPGAIQIMQGNQSILDVGSGTHFLCASHENAHLTGSYLRKKLFLFCFRVRCVDKSNLILRDACVQQLLF